MGLKHTFSTKQLVMMMMGTHGGNFRKLDAHSDEIEHLLQVAMTQLALKSELTQCTPRLVQGQRKLLVLAQCTPNQGPLSHRFVPTQTKRGRNVHPWSTKTTCIVAILSQNGHGGCVQLQLSCGENQPTDGSICPSPPKPKYNEQFARETLSVKFS